MIRPQAFAAIGASKAVAAPSTSSQSVTFASDVTTDNGTGVTDCMCINDTDKLGFVKFSKGAATATAADIPVRAGQTIILQKGMADTASVIMSAAPTAGPGFYFQAGMGG